MKKIKYILISLLLFCIPSLLTACQSSKNSKPSHHNHNFALITDVSGINDESFNQAAWDGIKTFSKDHNFSLSAQNHKVFTAKNDQDIDQVVKQASSGPYHTIFALGPNFENSILNASKTYPHKNFVIINGSTHGRKNIASANFKNQQAAYLAGVIAAKTTKTNVIGFIGGDHSRNIQKFERGFAQGIHDTAKKSHKNIKIIKQYTNSFSNPNKAETIANNIYSKKADIIFHAAGKSGEGVFKAAKDINQANILNKRVWVIGVDTDQKELGNYQAKGGQKANCTLTSVITGANIAVNNVATSTYEGKFPGGQNLTYDLKNGGVWVTHNPAIPTSTWISAQKAKEKIINKQIKINLN